MPDFIVVAILYAIIASALGSTMLVFARQGRRIGFDEYAAICYAFVCTGCVGNLSFFLYAFSTVVGAAFSLIVAGSIAIILFRTKGQVPISREVKTAFAVSALFGLVYLSCLYLWAPSHASNLPGVIFFEKARPPDFILPFQFADAIYQNKPSRTGIDVANWYHTDRPPLQTGFTLLFSPL